MAFTSWEQIRAYQLENHLKSSRIWVDTGHKTIECYQQCLRYGWIPTKGDKGEGYEMASENPAERRRVTIPFRVTRADPFLGTNKAGRTTVQLVRFSSAAYKDRLYLFTLRGLSLPWAIYRMPEDSPYLAELSADEMVIAGGKRQWIERGTNDYGDCEILQLVAADVHGITRHQSLTVDLTDQSNDATEV
jgi:hypothetical protein